MFSDINQLLLGTPIGTPCARISLRIYREHSSNIYLMVSECIDSEGVYYGLLLKPLSMVPIPTMAKATRAL